VGMSHSGAVPGWRTVSRWVQGWAWLRVGVGIEEAVDVDLVQRYAA